MHSELMGIYFLLQYSLKTQLTVGWCIYYYFYTIFLVIYFSRYLDNLNLLKIEIENKIKKSCLTTIFVKS